MIYNLTKEIQQSYSSGNETVKVDILYNDSFDYFYFNTYVEGELVKGDTRIVKDLMNDYVSFTSNDIDYANYEGIDSFTVEVFDNV